MSTLLNTLLLYPDHPYGFDEIWARRFDPVAKRYERFFVAAPAELSRSIRMPKRQISSATSRKSCGWDGVVRYTQPSRVRRT